MPPHPLTNFEIQKYYQNQPQFRGVYSRNNLSKMKDGAHIINLDKYDTAWKVSKYGAISGLYFPVFSPNTGKYGPEKTPYLDTFHAVTLNFWKHLLVAVWALSLSLTTI